MKFVLDAGSGARPWPQATILCDLHIGPTNHREGKPATVDDRPFVCCDLHALPFRTQGFSFVYSWHVLEHLADPTRALHELQRVGRHGFVAVPSGFWQFLFPNNPTHRWLIRPNGNHKPLHHNKPIGRLLARFWQVNWRIRFRERIRMERLGLRTHAHDQIFRW